MVSDISSAHTEVEPVVPPAYSSPPHPPAAIAVATLASLGQGTTCDVMVQADPVGFVDASTEAIEGLQLRDVLTSGEYTSGMSLSLPS